VHAELQEEDVLLYTMEVKETTSCVVCVITWRSDQMMKMKSPERKVLPQLQQFKCNTYNLSLIIGKIKNITDVFFVIS
jgi:hypothetical protein